MISKMERKTETIVTDAVHRNSICQMHSILPLFWSSFSCSLVVRERLYLPAKSCSPFSWLRKCYTEYAYVCRECRHTYTRTYVVCVLVPVHVQELQHIQSIVRSMHEGYILLCSSLPSLCFVFSRSSIDFPYGWCFYFTNIPNWMKIKKYLERSKNDFFKKKLWNTSQQHRKIVLKNE